MPGIRRTRTRVSVIQLRQIDAADGLLNLNFEPMRSMKPKTSLFLSLLMPLTAMFPTLKAETTLDAVLSALPAEPDMLVVVPDLNALRERWEASPLGDAFGEDWFEGLADAFEREDAEIPDSLEAWFEQVEGPLVFGIAELGGVFVDQTPPVIVLASGYSGDPEAWQVVVEEAFEDSEVILEGFDLEGIPALRVIDGAEDAPKVEFALIEGVQVMQVGGNGLLDALGRMDGAQPGFSEAWYPVGLSVDTHLGGEMAVFLKGERVWAGLEALIRAEIGMTPDPMVDAETLIEVLGLTGLRAMGMSIELEPNYVRLESDLNYATDGGLGSLLQFRTLKADTLPAMPEGALSVGRTGFDLSAMLTGAEGFFGRLFPAEFSEYEAQMTNFSNLLGVDIRAALFGGFGTEMTTYSLPGRGDDMVANDTYMVMELAPGGLLESLYDSLVRNFAMAMEWIETEPVGETTFNVVRLSQFAPVAEGEAGVYAWAFEDDALIFAFGSEGIHLRYAGVAEPEATESQDERASELLNRMGGVSEPIALSYSDLERTFENLGETMESIIDLSGDEEGVAFVEFLTESFDSVEMEAVSVSWIEGGVLRSRQDLVRKAED